MARTRKAIQPLNLARYDVLIEDRGVRSDYFKITQFDGYFYGGRNAFLVAGAGVLRPNSSILVEVLNSNGTTVYSAPVKSFVEGSSRLIQVEVYEDTPIGPGKIVILGSANFYLDGTPIPDEWRDKYNVRWMADVIISPLTDNKTPIRFVNTPEIVVEEKFYLAPLSSSFTESISIPVNLSFSPKYFNVFPNGYLLNLNGPGSTRFFNKYLDGKITGSVKFSGSNGSETASVDIPITRIFDSTTAESTGKLIYTDLNNLFLGGYVSASGQYTTNLNPFGNQTVTTDLNLLYNELNTTTTGSLVSFAKARLVNLSTISGEINKVRLSYKPATEPGEYVSLGEVKTFVAELFSIDSGSNPYETGRFNEDIVLDDYWYAATMSVAHDAINPIAPNYYYTSSLAVNPILQQCCTELLDAVRVEVPISSSGTTFQNNVSYFLANKENNTILLFPQSEYTLSFEALVSKTSGSYTLNQPDYSMEVYLVAESGSEQRILDTNTLGQLLGTLTPTTNFQKQNFETVELNFVPQIKTSGEFGIRFVVYGGFWNIANVSVKAAQEPFFSPDEFDILIPQVNYEDKILEFKAEYLDINNNSIGVSTVSLPTYFTGSEFFYDPFPYVGDAVITGSLTVTGSGHLVSISGSGITISASAFISNSLTVNNDITVGSDVNVGENLYVSGNSYLGNQNTDATIVSGTLNVTNNTTLNQNLTVNGNTVLGNAGTDTTNMSGSATISGSFGVSGSTNLFGFTTLQGIFERATIVGTAPPATVGFDVIDQVVLFHNSNTTNNWDINIRGNSTTTLNSILSIGQAVTIVHIVVNGGTPRYNTNVYIDGVLRTVRWQGGAPPAGGNANAADIYSYAIVKTGNAQYSIFAAQVIFG